MIIFALHCDHRLGQGTQEVVSPKYPRTRRNGAENGLGRPSFRCHLDFDDILRVVQLFPSRTMTSREPRLSRLPAAASSSSLSSASVFFSRGNMTLDGARATTILTVICLAVSTTLMKCSDRISSSQCSSISGDVFIHRTRPVQNLPPPTSRISGPETLGHLTTAMARPQHSRRLGSYHSRAP